MASASDIGFIAAATLVLIISVFSGFFVLQEVKDSTSQSQIDQGVLDKGMAALNVFNVGIVAVNVFFYIAGFILAYRVRTSPIFAFPALLVLGVSGYLSLEISNIYAAFANVSAMQGVTNQFPVLNVFMSNYLTVTLVLGGVLVLMLFSKSRQGREFTV